MIKIAEVTSKEQYNQAIMLFKEYATALDIDLEFQNFSSEIENISRHYARPNGCLYIAYKDLTPIGCFGVRENENSICELKRMYIKPEARGLGLGKILLKKAIETGIDLGYTAMRLDTLPTMTEAIKLYNNMGFYEIKPYRFNPNKNTLYLEIKLEI